MSQPSKKNYFSEFEKYHREHSPELNKARDKLEEILREILSDILNQDFFRVRLVEARVKEKNSLFDKLLEDKINPQIAFKTIGLVRDLLGARIVCHNINDITHIIGLLERHPDVFTIVRARGGKEKRWIEERHSELGYRGHHIDIQFAMDNKKFQAELQVRTLLQDAFATFMHHDIYKGPIKQVLSSHLKGMPNSISDLFYSLDLMAQTLRDYVEKNPISPDLKLRSIEAVHARMHSFSAYFNSGVSNDDYTSLSRTDRYFIENADAEYCHEIKGICKTPSLFEFVLGGDSGGQWLSEVKMEKIETDGSHKEQRFEINEIDKRVLNLVRNPKARLKNHDFRVSCKWKNIFENQIDYIFSPWGVYYTGASVDYHLEIHSNGRLMKAPKIYRVDINSKDTTNIPDMFDDLIQDGNLGTSMEFDGDQDCYVFKENDMKGLLICLMYFNEIQ